MTWFDQIIWLKILHLNFFWTFQLIAVNSKKMQCHLGQFRRLKIHFSVSENVNGSQILRHEIHTVSVFYLSKKPLFLLLVGFHIMIWKVFNITWFCFNMCWICRLFHNNWNNLVKADRLEYADRDGVPVEQQNSYICRKQNSSKRQIVQVKQEEEHENVGNVLTQDDVSVNHYRF